tara:strand:+ start:543 stop:782 length:240 start_codon:yes stop_codon:yes gene_type:complete
VNFLLRFGESLKFSKEISDRNYCQPKMFSIGSYRMGVKISSLILLILGIFIAKISFENFNQAIASSPDKSQTRTTASSR